jgi:hypothetical protein
MSLDSEEHLPETRVVAAASVAIEAANVDALVAAVRAAFGPAEKNRNTRVLRIGYERGRKDLYVEYSVPKPKDPLEELLTPYAALRTKADLFFEMEASGPPAEVFCAAVKMLRDAQQTPLGIICPSAHAFRKWAAGFLPDVIFGIPLYVDSASGVGDALFYVVGGVSGTQLTDIESSCLVRRGGPSGTLR